MFSLGVGWGSGFRVASSGSCHALMYSASDCACELCVCVCAWMGSSAGSGPV